MRISCEKPSTNETVWAYPCETNGKYHYSSHINFWVVAQFEIYLKLFSFERISVTLISVYKIGTVAFKSLGVVFFCNSKHVFFV